MQWKACPGSSQWEVGMPVQIIRFLLDGEPPTAPTANDSLVVDFPNNSRARGTVVSASANQIVVSIAGKNWNLQSAGALHTAKSGQLKFNYVVKASV